MPDDEKTPLDRILATRLELLDQAANEVKRVIDAIAVQTNRLSKVENFLVGGGTLSDAEVRLIRQVSDARTQLTVALHDLPEAARHRRLDVEAAREQQDGELDSPLSHAARHVDQALQEIEAVAAARRQALHSFGDVQRWSIAGLEDASARSAISEYKKVIAKIRADDHPWTRYESEIPRRGYELFDRYLELVAGMAVRGFGLGENIMSDVRQLVKLLRQPLARTDEPTVCSPLTLMGSLGKRHIPLGYPEWSLWALPLVGRSVGEEVADILLEDTEGANARLLCADLYAQYVLGPSYVVAATFLEFDPNPEAVRPDGPPDALRVHTLLDHLPTLGNGQHREVLDPVVAVVRGEWEVARGSFGGTDPVLDDGTRLIIERFLETLAEQYPDTAYDVDTLSDVNGDAHALADAGDPDDESSEDLPNLSTRALMWAMWQGRLLYPDRAAKIHKRAKTVASGSRAARPIGIPSGRAF